MTNTVGAAGNNNWALTGPYSGTLNGLGGTDTLSMGTSLRSSYTIVQLADGGVQVDTLSGASQAFHTTVYNMERLVFGNGKDTLDLTTYFGGSTPYTGGTYSPGNLPVNVPLGSKSVAINFSETIQKGSGSINLKTTSGSLIASYQVSSSNVSISGTSKKTLTITFDPGTSLTNGTTYVVEFVPGSLKDSTGNNFDFTTGTTGAVNQTINGTTGNDATLAGGPGNDTINGLAGIDTVVYAPRMAAYTITPATTATGATTVSGPDGVDTLTNVERLQFADAFLAFDTDGNAGQTYRLYQAAFNRTPDLSGLGGWIAAMDAGMTPIQVATSFMASAEFQTLYGSSPTDEQFVSLLSRVHQLIA